MAESFQKVEFLHKNFESWGPEGEEDLATEAISEMSQVCPENADDCDRMANSLATFETLRDK